MARFLGGRRPEAHREDLVLAALGQHGHYWEIILPGATVGLIVGFATQRYGTSATITRAGQIEARSS